MNAIKLILVFTVVMSLFTSCKQAASEPKLEGTAKKSSVPIANLETASFTIEGMTCAIGCAKTIQDELSELDGVQKATVDFDKKIATISFDGDKQSPEKLVKVVESTGDGSTYKVSNVKASGNKAMLIQNQEKEKEKEKKDTKKETCSSDEKKSKEEKSSCCSKKKHCEKEEKKSKSM